MFTSLKKHTFTRFAITAAMATVVAAMGYHPQAKAAGIVIKQWYHQYGEAGTQDAVQRYADEYHQLHPDITIEINWVLGDYQTKLSAALQTNDAPDVYETSPFVTADLVQANQVADLSDLYTPDVIKDFGASMGFVTINGKPYGVKMINDPIALYYRKSVLDAAGVKPPTTMDELIAAAKKLTTNKQSGLFMGNDYGKDARIAKMVIFSAGGDLTKDGKAAFNTDRVAQAWAKLKELVDSGSLLVGSPTDWWDPSALTDGTAAMQLCGMWALPGVKKALGDDFGVIPWPGLDASGTPASTLGGWSEVVNPKSANLDAAKAFVKWEWIENAKIQQDWSVAYGFHIPPRASVAASTDALGKGQAADFIALTTKYAKLEGGPFWTPAMDQALIDQISNILTNGADPKQAMDTAAQKINALLVSVNAPGAVATAAK
jgi:multiple sugar transport system substrate-binding protein